MKTLHRYIAVVPFVFLMGCQQQPTTLTDLQRTEIVEQVTARQTQLIGTFGALDPVAVSEFLSQDGFLAYVSTDHYLDRAALLDSVTTWFARRDAAEYELNTLEVYPLTADLAVADVTIAGFVTRNDGVRLRGFNVFTLIWQRESEGWHITHYRESARYNEVAE